jgi:hypothetical protein
VEEVWRRGKGGVQEKGYEERYNLGHKCHVTEKKYIRDDSRIHSPQSYPKISANRTPQTLQPPAKDSPPGDLISSSFLMSVVDGVCGVATTSTLVGEIAIGGGGFALAGVGENIYILTTVRLGEKDIEG